MIASHTEEHTIPPPCGGFHGYMYPWVGGETKRLWLSFTFNALIKLYGTVIAM